MPRSPEATGESARVTTNIREHSPILGHYRDPTKARVQKPKALHFGCNLNLLHWCGSRKSSLKPVNVIPMAIMLIAIIFLIVWLRPH